MSTITARTTRNGALDALRGVAILLMVLDHALVLVEPGHPLRYTLTRLSLPLFMVCAGAVLRPPSWRRLRQLAPAVVVESTFGVYAIGTAPGIVTLYVLAAAVLTLPAVRRLGAGPALVLGLVQALYLPVGWTGYQPGLVVAWLSLGLLAAQQFFPLAPRATAVASVGRHPVPWYCGHLVVLAGIRHYGVLGV